jgi:hypothetical protein
VQQDAAASAPGIDQESTKANTHLVGAPGDHHDVPGIASGAHEPVEIVGDR